MKVVLTYNGKNIIVIVSFTDALVCFTNVSLNFQTKVY